jgi:hypothetical protein
MELSQLNQLSWNTDVDWNKGTLGADTEVVGVGSTAKLAPKTTLISGTEIYLNWRLNETSGTTASDSSQYNRPGTLVTVEGYNPSQWVSGKLNNCWCSPGEYESANYIDGGDIAAFEWDDPFSIEFWLDSVGYDIAIAGNYNSTEVKGWWVGMQEGYIRFNLVGNSENFLQVYSNGNIPPGFHHVLITYNGNGLASGVKFYLDGVLAENSIYLDALNETSIVPTTNKFKIGALSDVTWGFIGKLDEFNLYATVLSQENVDFRYNSGDGTETPLFTQPTYPVIAHYETNIVDSKIVGQLWNEFNIVRTTPSGTAIEIKVRVSDDANNMGSYGVALDPADDIALTGQFIQFSIDFTGTIDERALIDYITVLYIAPIVHVVSP